MKTNGKRYSANWTAFLGVLAAGCFVATAAQAEPRFKGRFQLDHEIHWGSAVLEPGAYSLALDQPTQTIVVRDEQSGKTVAREPIRGDYNSDRGDSKLLIAVHGNERAVYGLRIAGLGEVYQKAHPSAGNARTEEAQRAEAVRVEVAQK
jgi:hypothetical protein